MKRISVLPTLLVGIAVVAMVALGLWQLLIRLPEKEAQLAQLAANPGRPALLLPVATGETLLFRRASGVCHAVGPVRLVGAGTAGFRALAQCRAEAGTAGMPVALGTTHDPMAKVGWTGGPVAGYLSHAPDARPLLAGLWDHTPRGLMLVADTPPSGLARNAPPDLSAVPNNHLAYAGQWFFFAAVASIIYVLAVRRRSTSARGDEGRPAR